MKIDTDILRTREGKLVWADDNPSGYGTQVHRAGKDVSEEWLLRNGLIEPEPEPEAPKAPAKTAAAKQSPKSADKNVKGPGADK